MTNETQVQPRRLGRPIKALERKWQHPEFEMFYPIVPRRTREILKDGRFDELSSKQKVIIIEIAKQYTSTNSPLFMRIYGKLYGLDQKELTQ